MSANQVRGKGGKDRREIGPRRTETIANNSALHFQQRLAPLARAGESTAEEERNKRTSDLKYALLNPARPRAAAEIIMCTIRTWSLALAVQVVHVSSAPGTQYGTHAVAIRNVEKRREKAVVPHASLPLLRHLHTRIESSLFVCPDVLARGLV